jgi:DnaJ-class molecular chaperone
MENDKTQGGITNDSKGLPTSAEGKDSERLCSFCDGKGGWGSGEDADGCTLCNGTGKDTDKEATK